MMKKTSRSAHITYQLPTHYNKPQKKKKMMMNNKNEKKNNRESLHIII